ncbi:MAG: glycosyltransferase family 2 protein [Flavobacteriales bacterium]
MNYKLSIAIVTRHRPESLERTLKSLVSQEVTPFEILISDDSKLEDMISANKRLAQIYGCHYYTGPGKGLYANRNFIAKQCKGTHFRSMDDDHEFPENHIKDCMEAIQLDDKAIWVIGEYYPWDKERPIPSPAPGQLHPRGFSYAPSQNDEYFAISCGATIYPISVVEQNILNSEAYQFGKLYLEYGLRLKAKGYNIKHLSSTYVIHHIDENKGTSIATAADKHSLNISNGAKIYAMLMLSFKYKKTLKNQLLTLMEIGKGLITNQISIAALSSAYSHYKKDA